MGRQKKRGPSVSPCRSPYCEKSEKFPTRQGRNKPCASRRHRLSGRQVSLMVGVVVQTYLLEEGASLAVPPRTLNRLEPGSRWSRGCEQLHECCPPPT